MPKIEPGEPIEAVFVPESRTQYFTVRVKGKSVNLDFGNETAILFWDKKPVAVAVGNLCYHIDKKHGGALTKAIQAFAHDWPLIRTAPQDFDFVVGGLLTKAGIPLTRRSL